MIKPPTILTRRSVFRAGTGLAIAAAVTPMLTPASVRAEDARQAGAEPLNGDGFYRFKIGDFQATVISDGYGQLPIRPILAMNVSEAELAPMLKTNFMQPVVQITNNILVVDTGRERILVDSGFGEKLGPSFGSFPSGSPWPTIGRSLPSPEYGRHGTVHAAPRARRSKASIRSMGIVTLASFTCQ